MFSFSILEDNLVTFLFENTYRAFYVIVSYFYFHNFTANGGAMSPSNPGNAPGASWPGNNTNFPQPSRDGSGIYWARGSGGGQIGMTSGVNGGPGNLWVWEA